jgi:pyruvate,water dikinase
MATAASCASWIDKQSSMSAATPAFVCRFAEIGIGDRPTVGGKGASLGELTRAGIRVPPGSVITTSAFEHFLAAVDADGRLRREVAALSAEDLAAIAEVTADVRSRIEEAPMPAALRMAIVDGYRTLCHGAREAGVDMPVAIRSSATAEDSAEASFAGLQDTYLWVRGEEVALEHVRRCWASLYSIESVSYRRRLKLPEQGLAMGVVIQRMVHSRCSGVMFTRSPTTGDRSVVTLEGGWGLGSSIVSGEVTPDRFVVSKVTGEIVKRTISRKCRQHLPDFSGSGIVDSEVPAHMQEMPCLSDAEVLELARIACRVERHYGAPQDIEWAIARDMPEGEAVYLLQSRPETAWASREVQPAARPKAKAFEHVFATLGGGTGRK